MEDYRLALIPKRSMLTLIYRDNCRIDIGINNSKGQDRFVLCL